MTIVVELPGAAPLELDHVLLDVNGTLTRDGRLLDGVADAIAGLRDVVTSVRCPPTPLAALRRSPTTSPPNPGTSSTATRSAH